MSGRAGGRAGGSFSPAIVLEGPWNITSGSRSNEMQTREPPEYVVEAAV